MGHLIKDCRRKKREDALAHLGFSRSADDNSGQEWAFVANSGPNADDAWIYDTGATRHMTPCEADLTTLEVLPSPVMVNGVSATPLQAFKQGTAVLEHNGAVFKLHKTLLVLA